MSGTITFSGTNNFTDKVGIQDSNPPQKLHIDEVAGFDVSTLSSSSTGQQTVDSFSATAFRTAKYLIQIHNTTDSDYQALELLLFHGGLTYTYGTSSLIMERRQLYRYKLRQCKTKSSASIYTLKS